MKFTKQIIAGVAIASALASMASAAIIVNDSLSIDGYVVGSVQGYDFNADKDSMAVDESDWSMDMDAVLLGVQTNLNEGRVKGRISVYARGRGGCSSQNGYNLNPVILDAFVDYLASEGVVITMGNFKSELGYESFHIVGNQAISYGADYLQDWIPGYSTGVKVTVVRGNWTGGIAIKDSIYNYDGVTDSYNVFKGDGDLDQGAGAEAFVKFQQDALTAFLGLAYDNGDGYDGFTGDLWVQYVIDSTTVFGEFCYGTDNEEVWADGNVYFIIVGARQKINDTWAGALRASYGSEDYDGEDAYDFWMGTASAIITVTENLEVVVEFSYADYEDGDAIGGGVQGRFHF